MLLSLLAGAIGGTITGLLVSHIITRHAHSDYRAHAKMASLAVDPGAIYGHFLYFVTVARAAGWSADIHRILDATPFVLGAAIGIAIVVAQQLVRSLAGITGTRSGALPEVGIALTVVALFFSFSLPTTTNYIGQFPPMVWHNSTVLFLMPFAIGLYFATLKMLERPTRWLVGLVMLLVALNVAAKPSFVLAWIPAVPLFAVVNRLNRRAIVTSIVTSLYALALIGVQSHYIFHSAASARLYKIMDIQVTGVKIVPFYVWNVYSDNQLFSLLASNVLTLTAVAVYRRKLLSWQQFQLAACLYVRRAGDLDSLLDAGICSVCCRFPVADGSVHDADVPDSCRVFLEGIAAARTPAGN